VPRSAEVAMDWGACTQLAPGNGRALESRSRVPHRGWRARMALPELPKACRCVLPWHSLRYFVLPSGLHAPFRTRSTAVSSSAAARTIGDERLRGGSARIRGRRPRVAARPYPTRHSSPCGRCWWWQRSAWQPPRARRLATGPARADSAAKSGAATLAEACAWGAIGRVSRGVLHRP